MIFFCNFTLSYYICGGFVTWRIWKVRISGGTLMLNTFKYKAMSSSTVASKTDLVKLRSRSSSNGRLTLYLDYVQFGERVRESIGLSLIPGKSPEVKEKNRKTMAKAEAMRLEKENDLLSDAPVRDNNGAKTPFLAYYRTMMEDRKQSDGNYGNWKSCYKYLQVYCTESTTFGEITPRWVQGFKSYLETVEKDTTKMNRRPHEGFNGLSQNSKCSYFNKLRACLNQAYKEGIIASNPADPVKGFKADEAERQYLTIDEVKKMADTYCKYPHLKRAFLFGCFTGLRKSDIEKLTWGEVQRFGDYTRLVFKQKKTGGQEYLDIPKVAEPYLGKQGDKTSEDLVFPLFKYSSETSLELRRWALAAGITKDFTFHCSRHTFAVMLLNSGTDIYTVSKLLGHREIATTQIYAHLVDARKQEAVDKISDIFNDL